MSQHVLTQIAIPDFGGQAEEVTVVTWLKEVGDAVGVGEPILEVMTDKANMEVQSSTAGTLFARLVEKDAVIKVGAVVATIEVRAE